MLHPPLRAQAEAEEEEEAEQEEKEEAKKLLAPSPPPLQQSLQDSGRGGDERKEGSIYVLQGKCPQKACFSLILCLN